MYILSSQYEGCNLQWLRGERKAVGKSRARSIPPPCFALPSRCVVIPPPLTAVRLWLCRYLRNEIYTWVGANHSVLVSVNPFKQLPIYTITVMHDFAKPAPNRLLPPHTFALANNAYLQVQSFADVVCGARPHAVHHHRLPTKRPLDQSCASVGPLSPAVMP
jgi:hypothetical protein